MQHPTNLYLGSASGLVNSPIALAVGTTQALADVNGDGYADYIVGDASDGIGKVEVYLGGPAGVAATPSVTIVPVGELQFGESIGAQ